MLNVLNNFKVLVVANRDVVWPCGFSVGFSVKGFSEKAKGMLFSGLG